MAEHTPVMPHGEIKEIFPDVFFVTGTSRPDFGGRTWQFSRNMTIVRDAGALTLVNTVRLNDDGLARLDGLGRVVNVVKLGAFHGIDDAFYLERYGAKQWALARAEHFAGHATDQELRPGGPMPFAGASPFVFETAKQPEGLLLLERHGGILISCDSLQNWDEVDAYFDDESAQHMTEIGFIRPANIGPGWRQRCEPEAADFARLKALPFRHLVPAHGKPIRDFAHEQLCATFKREFNV